MKGRTTSGKRSGQAKISRPDGHGIIRVIGIDPGISNTGYGVVDADERGQLTHIECGSIPTSSRSSFVERLSKIHRELDALFHTFQPQHMAVEQVFFARNARSALLLGQARGVTILSAALAEIPVFEYAATEAKKAVCSYGGAGKAQVNTMVKTLLGVKKNIPDHASDALALCICHITCYRTLQAKTRSLERSGKDLLRKPETGKGTS